MSCGHPPAYVYVGPSKGGIRTERANPAGSSIVSTIYGNCLPHDARAQRCPAGYSAADVVGIDWKLSEKRGGPVCVQDSVPFGDYRRWAKRCRKTSWSDMGEYQRFLCINGYVDGTKDPYTCAPNWCEGTPSSDAFMKNYCRKKENWGKIECACLLPAEQYDGIDTLGPIHCVDKRCARNARAYKTAAQRSECTIQDIDCSIGNINITAEGLARINDIVISQHCPGLINQLKAKVAEKNDTETPNGGGSDNTVGESETDIYDTLFYVAIGVVLVSGVYLAYKKINK